MFSFQLISVLLTGVTFYTYLANIVFSCDWAFNLQLQCRFQLHSHIWLHSHPWLHSHLL